MATPQFPTQPEPPPKPGQPPPQPVVPAALWALWLKQMPEDAGPVAQRCILMLRTSIHEQMRAANRSQASIHAFAVGGPQPEGL
jgi:hypothetical protein